MKEKLNEKSKLLNGQNNGQDDKDVHVSIPADQQGAIPAPTLTTTNKTLLEAFKCSSFEQVTVTSKQPYNKVNNDDYAEALDVSYIVDINEPESFPAYVEEKTSKKDKSDAKKDDKESAKEYTTTFFKASITSLPPGLGDKLFGKEFAETATYLIPLRDAVIGTIKAFRPNWAIEIGRFGLAGTAAAKFALPIVAGIIVASLIKCHNRKPAPEFFELPRQGVDGQIDSAGNKVVENLQSKEQNNWLKTWALIGGADLIDTVFTAIKEKGLANVLSTHVGWNNPYFAFAVGSKVAIDLLQKLFTARMEPEAIAYTASFSSCSPV